ncbi:hypothetical protein DVH24_036282 [Malus domestica]|uniref:Uncharacterized protein n=1 Tax=Malus domestica TaxID=3750 RepID=A0A498IKG2_MALDO|nr:hypothetical protein DVH24_036282 [Malus domestica]
MFSCQIFTLQVINGMRAADTRSRTSQQGMKKIPGCSWIEVNGVVHELLVGDKSHALSDKIYAKLHELAKELKAAGYVPTTDFVYCWDIEEEEKEHFLGCQARSWPLRLV